MRRSKNREKTNQVSSEASDKSSEFGDFDEEGFILWNDVADNVDSPDFVLCDLKVDILEHIIASLLYWNKRTVAIWSCVQVIEVETITEEKRVLILELVNKAKEYDVVYFVSHELVDKYYVEQFELTKQSRQKLSKVTLVGAKVSRR